MHRVRSRPARRGREAVSVMWTLSGLACALPREASKTSPRADEQRLTHSLARAVEQVPVSVSWPTGAAVAVEVSG